MITVTYTSIDRLRKKRSFKTLAGARRFAHKWVGPHPDIGYDEISGGYAVSFDGIGKVTWSGCVSANLFPPLESDADRSDDDHAGSTPA